MWKEPEVYIGDTVSIGIVVGTIAEVLPHIAAALSVIWFAIRIWETETVRDWTGRSKPNTGEQDGD